MIFNRIFVTIVHQLSAKRAAYPYRGNSSGSTIRCLFCNVMKSITHQPTAGILCMTPILVAGLVEARHLLGHQVLPMLYLSLVYISGHLKSLMDTEKTSS